MLDPIRSLWVGNELSTLERMCIESYQRVGHEFHLYSYNFVENVPPGTFYQEAEDIVPKAAIGVFQNLANFSDYFRYTLLYRHGGYWVDLDNFCLRPYDFQVPYVFSSQRPGPTSFESEINAGVIRVPEPCTPIMRFCLDQVAAMDTKTNHWSQIGPGLLMDAYHRFNLERYLKPYKTFCPIDYFTAPASVVGEGTWNTPFDLNTYSVHLWNEEMRRAGVDKNAKYPNSLYERLKATGR